MRREIKVGKILVVAVTEEHCAAADNHQDTTVQCSPVQCSATQHYNTTHAL